MQVSDIMTRDVVTVLMDDTLRWVRDVFEQHRFRHLIVTEHGRVVGVLSDRDLLKHISPFVGKMAERSQDLASLERKVHQVMTRDLVWCTPDTPIRDAAKLLHEKDISCLPVIEDCRDCHRCVGIVTPGDILDWMIKFLASDLPQDEADGLTPVVDHRNDTGAVRRSCAEPGCRGRDAA